MGRVSPAKTPVVMPALQPRRKLHTAAIVCFVWWVLCQLGFAGAAIVYWLHGQTMASGMFAMASLLSCTIAATTLRRRYARTPVPRLPPFP